MAKFTKKDLTKIFWRSWPLMGSFNYERLQAQGFAYAMIPILRKLYPEKEDFVAAMKRHLTFFNTTPQCVPFILGTTIAFEEQYAEDPENSDVEAINAVKAALMGPLAGIGDSFFWGTFRVVGAGIGAPMCVAGNFLGTLIFLLVYNVPNFWVRWKGIFLGYKSGMTFVEDASENGIFEKLTEAAKILGLIVIGGMMASMVTLSTPLVLHFSKSTFKVQETLNTVFPSILPLLATLATWKAVKKGISTTVILVLIIVISIIGKYLGIL